MTTTGLDYRALSAAIVREPEEDTPRLVLADWLDEHGTAADRDRAEFIRAQCELEANAEQAGLHQGDPNEQQNPCPACIYFGQLRTRERDLFARYEADWRRGPVCGACRGSGKVQGPREDASYYFGKRCPACHGTGDAGGLTWHQCVDVVTRRGFPWRVTTSRLADALEEVTVDGCGTCRARPGRPHERHCSAVRKMMLAPTPWLAAVLSAHPVAEVVVGDKEPALWELSGGRGARWSWFDDARSQGSPACLPSSLCALITGHLPESEAYGYRFDSRDRAVSACARAIVAVAVARQKTEGAP